MEQCDGQSDVLPTCLEEQQLGLQSQVCRHSAVDVLEHAFGEIAGIRGFLIQRA